MWGWQEGESELEEVERQLAGSGKPAAKTGSKGALANGEAAGKGGLGGLLPPILLQAFVLTFLAEWGDRSQARVFCSPAPSHQRTLLVQMWSTLHSSRALTPDPSLCDLILSQQVRSV
jgi:putative Ca2+/H+ antiporter (TMEM165/GDT1 family)